MRPMRTAGFAAILLCSILGAGCGDVFRPIGFPIGTNPGGDPQARRHALILSQGAPGQAGAVTFANVSGDTNVGNRVVGVEPVHAGFNPGASRTFIANRGDDTLHIMVTDLLTFPVTQLTLPAGSAPAFVLAATPSEVYVAFSGLDTVGVIGPTDILLRQIPVGNTPVALAVNGDGSKLYCVNRGGNTVTVIRTGDFEIQTTIPVGDTPVWVVGNPAGTFLYVLNRGSSTVSVISTATDTVTATLPVGAAPNTIHFDRRLLRLYVPNTGGNTVHIFKADVDTPVLLAEVTVGAAPTAVAPLEDGLRAYVANSGSNNVSVLSTTSNTVLRTIAVGAGPAWIAASADATKVFTANRDANTISIIRTSDETVGGTLQSGSPQPFFILVTP
jgi:YVTN family beta-propeller protein